MSVESHKVNRVLKVKGIPMIRILSFIILFFPLIVFSQAQTEDELNQNKFFLGANAGFNASRFINDSLDLTNGYRPYIGLYAKYRIIENLYLKSSVSYSVKGSTSLKPDVKIKNRYIDVNFMPQYQVFDGFYLLAGVSYSNILSPQYITRDGSSSNGLDYKNINGYESEFNLLAGLEFRLHENVTFEFNYTIPLKENNTSSFQLGINILLYNRHSDKTNFGEIRRIKSNQQILQMKNSVLLVRLKTSANTIAALRKIGDEDEANEVMKKQIIENKLIIKEFKENFDFCNVRFFYNNRSRDIKKNKFDNVFLDDSLQIDNSIKINTESVFIAEFGNLEQDTAKHFSDYSYERNDEGIIEEVENYYSPGIDFSFYALRIMDDNFVQLSRPFPYYVKVGHSISLKWNHKRAIINMNSSLNNYYEFNKKKEK